MSNFKNKLLMLIAFSSITTSIMPLTFFDDGSIVHRGGPGEGREHFWNRGRHDRDSRNDDHDSRDSRKSIKNKKESTELDRNKKLDSQTRKRQRKEIQNKIDELEEELKNI